MNVVAGTPTTDVNFVDEQPGSISGTVLADTDNDDDGDDPCPSHRAPPTAFSSAASAARQPSVAWR